MAKKLTIGSKVASDKRWEVATISSDYTEFGIIPTENAMSEMPATVITFRSGETVAQVNDFLDSMQVP